MTVRALEVRGSAFEPVPRVLHQVWNTRDVPPQWRGFQETWRRHHPGWEHVLWTSEDHRRLIAEHHSWFLPVYDGFPRHVQRVDAAKLFILYTHGGVYADLDTECLRSIEPLLASGGAVVGRSHDGVIDCSVLASPPRHPLWELAFEEMRRPPLAVRAFRNVPLAQAAHVLFSTGPQMLRRAVRRYLSHGRRHPEAPGITVLDPRYLSSRTYWSRHEPFREPEAYVHHHYATSWLLPGERTLTGWLTTRRMSAALAALLLAGAGIALARWLS